MYLKKELEWKNINYTIDKKILTNNSGIVYSGEISAIMGPSGSGKTTLLNLLSGRVNNTNGKVEGKIVFQGIKLKKRQIAYVMQEDNISQFLSVKEAIQFSYEIRKGNHNLIEKIDNIIKILNLKKCEKHYIKDISGGEKKRVAIGIELICDPEILFLDEPTSGLDSYNCLSLVQNLKNIAYNNNCLVLLTIHQPSSEIFYLMDKLVLLKEGYSIYQGSLTGSMDYFETIGYSIPTNYNPADFILLKLQTESLDSLNKKIKVENRQSITKSSFFSHRLVDLKPSFIKQLFLLSKREYQNVVRDRGTLIARFGIGSLLNLLFALIFTNCGISDDIMTHFGGIVQVAISAMFASTNPTLLTFPIERPIFIREYYSGSYDIIPYFLSKLIVELPLSFLLTLLNLIIRYWIMQLQGNFFYLVLEIWLLGLVASSIALFLGSVTRNIKVSLELSPLIFVPQIMFAGFFIKMEQIPNYLRWAQYLCSLKFTINLLMITEFGDCPPRRGEEQQIACDKLLIENDVNRDLWWLYLLILISLFIFFRLFSLVLLHKLSKNFY